MVFTPHRLRSILSAKLGRCPRCIRSSILGTIICWPLFAALWLVDLPGSFALLRLLALACALAFTGLMLAHLGVFTRRVLRTMPGSDALGRRQFLSNAFGLGVAVFASALFGPSCRRPSPTEATAALDVAGGTDGTVDQAVVDQCAICLDECVRIFGSCTEAADSTEERAECVRVFQRCQERCRLAGRPCFVPTPPPAPQRCSPLSGSVCDANKANLPARCTTQCAPGTQACMDLANQVCRGALQGPIFTRRVGGQELFCQWCACICGTFVPPA